MNNPYCMWLLIGVVAGGDSAGPSGLSGGGGPTVGDVVKSAGRGVLRQSRGIVKHKTMKDVSRLSRKKLHCRVTVTSDVNVSVQGVHVRQKYMSRLRSGRSFSSDNLEIPEVVELSGDEDVPKSRRRYASSKFCFF